MADETYQPKVYRDLGGDRQVIADGGKQTVESGGEVDFESGSDLKIAGTKVTASAAALNSAGSGVGSLDVINKTGSTIDPDKLVAISGLDATSGKPKIVLADADVAAHEDVWVTTEAIANDAEGTVVKFALSAADLNTNSASAAGDPVYLSTTAGGFTHTAPTTSVSRAHPVGMVVVKDATEGQILWNIGPVRKFGVNELQEGTLAASSAGRALMATDYFNAATVLAKFATGSFDATAMADLLANNAFTNAILQAVIANDAFTASSATRAKFQDGIWIRAKLAADARRAENAIADPGDAGAIPVTANGTCPLVSAGVETRTLAIPTFVGQEITLAFKTDGGDVTVTSAEPINMTGNNTITFDNAGEVLSLRAIEEGAALRWRVLFNDGAGLSTVG